MAATSFNENFFMKSAVDEVVWKILSSEFNWSEALLEKYEDKIDWKELSKNNKMLWTIPILHKYEKRLDWDELTNTLDDSFFTESALETFKEKWDWHLLSKGCFLTDELLLKYADKLDWYNIACWYRRDKSGIDFYNRYKDYLPDKDKWWGSELWDAIVCQRKEQLICEIQQGSTEDIDI